MFALTDQARARRQGLVYGTPREVVPNRTAHMSIRDAAEAGRFAVGPASFQPVPETDVSGTATGVPRTALNTRESDPRFKRFAGHPCSMKDGRWKSELGRGLPS